MKLILHIGTHKTGTTAIQRFLASNKEALKELGVAYPGYGDVLKDKESHYAHIDIPKGLMGQSKTLSPDDSREFLRGIREYGEVTGCNTVILSAESFMRGALGPSSKKWNKIDAFVKEVRDSLLFDDVEISLTLRNLSTYLPSLYNEHIKVTDYHEDIVSFYHQFRERFNYPRIIHSWQKCFPNVKCVQYETLGKGEDFIKNWLNNVLSIEDFTKLNFSGRPRNISWPLEFVAIKRDLNKHLTTQERSKLRTAITTYLELEDVSKESFPNETWLTPSIMESIVNSHESEFKEVLPSYGIKAEALLDYSEVENQRRFQGVSEETYNSFLKAIFKRNV
tara:strand:+ start:4971 stop:5978 length:1008 start_codon:yes stop_codon:yes gene_type:complete